MINKKIFAILVCILMELVTTMVVAGQTIEMNQQKKVLSNEFLLAGKECDPSIDVEKYVWDPKLEEWIDADTENEALDIRPCKDITFKVVIYNDGDCRLVNIILLDTMSDDLKFISSDPEPDEFWYEEPFYNLVWYYPFIEQTQEVVYYITAHVEGPYCRVDYNHALAEGECLHGNSVVDEDYAYVHPKKWNMREVNKPFLNFFDNHPYLFPILKKLLLRFGL